ncbi:hypothetical protein AB5N96_09035 [Chryseomicrobium imtechense]
MKTRKWKRMTAAAMIATMTVTGATYAWADEYKSVSLNDIEETTAPVVDSTDVENDNLYEETAPSNEELKVVFEERIAKLNELIVQIDDEEITALLTQAVERFESKIAELEAGEDVEEPVDEETPIEGAEPVEGEEPTDENTELEMKKEQLAFKIAIMTKVYEQVGSDQARTAIQANIDKFQSQLDALNEKAPVEEPVIEEPVEEEPVVEEPVVEEPTIEEEVAEEPSEKQIPAAAVAGKVKAEENKAKAEEKKAAAQGKAEKKVEKAQAKADEAKSKADEKVEKAQAKADEAKAKAEEKVEKAQAKADEAQANAEEKKAAAKEKGNGKK